MWSLGVVWSGLKRRNLGEHENELRSTVLQRGEIVCQTVLRRGMAHCTNSSRGVMVTVARRTMLRWVAFDFETSDLSPARGNIVQIGAVDARGTMPPFQTLVGLPAGKKMNPYATRANGISNAMLSDAQPFVKEYARWRHWMQVLASSPMNTSPLSSPVSPTGAAAKAFTPSPLLLVAHNAKFDLGFLRAEMTANQIDASISIPNILFADSLPVMRSLKAGVMKDGKHVCKLDTLHERWCGGPIENAHDALNDAAALVRVVCAVPGALEALCRAATDINGKPHPMEPESSEAAMDDAGGPEPLLQNVSGSHRYVQCKECGDKVSPYFWDSHLQSAHSSGDGDSD